MDERVDVLDAEALGDPLGAGDVTGIAPERYPPVDELIRRDASEGKNGLAFEVAARLVPRLTGVGEAALGSSRPQRDVPKRESEDDGSDGVTSLMRSENRPGKLVRHGSKVRMAR